MKPIRGSIKNFSIVLLVFVTVVGLININYIYADDLDDLNEEKEQKEEEKEETEEELEDVKESIYSTNQSLSSVASDIETIEAEISKVKKDKKALEDEITQLEKEIKNLNKKHEDEYDEYSKAIQELYKLVSENEGDLTFTILQLDSADDVVYFQDMQDSLYQEVLEVEEKLAVARDKQKKLDKDYIQVEELSDELANLQSELKGKKQNYNNLLSSYYSEKEQKLLRIDTLNSEISELQRQIVLIKSGGTFVDAGSVPGNEDLKNTLAGFQAQSPAGTFGVFSFGAYTHRNGMSQWGAKARAEAGQSFNQILEAYYPGHQLQSNYSEPDKIKVQGWGVNCNNQSKYYNETVDFDTYLNRIFEMPAYWHTEALKAQAIAARSYAIYKHNTSGYLVPNQSNQVYKNCDNLNAWKGAVQSTKGYVLTKNSQAALVQYAAVHGGWGNHVHWDTTDGNGGSGNWTANAWESKSGVSWFYKIWYRDTSNGFYGGDCGHEPWMTSTEMADILNALVVWQNGTQEERSHISPVTTSCWGGDPYSHEQMKNVASKYGDSYSNVENAWVSIEEDANKSVYVVATFSTDNGMVTVSGNDFKEIFVLRAPGYLTVSPGAVAFFNIQKK